MHAPPPASCTWPRVSSRVASRRHPRIPAWLLAAAGLLGACTGGAPQDEVTPRALDPAALLVPTSDVAKGNMTVDGDGTYFYRNIDDGTSFAAADNGTTTIRNHWADAAANYTAGYSGAPAGTVTQVVANFRAKSDSGISGAIQVQLYDGATLVASGPVHALSSSWANFSDTFSGLAVASGNSLRTQILLTRTASTGYVR